LVSFARPQHCAEEGAFQGVLYRLVVSKGGQDSGALALRISGETAQAFGACLRPRIHYFLRVAQIEATDQHPLEVVAESPSPLEILRGLPPHPFDAPARQEELDVEA